MSIPLNPIIQHGPKPKWGQNIPRTFITCVFLWSNLTAPAYARKFLSLPQNLNELTLSPNNEKPIETGVSDSQKTAQLFYPGADENQNIKVVGIGQASQAADRAIFRLLFTFNPASQPDLGPLQVEDLEPVIDALADEGISRSAIETKLKPARQGLPFPLPFPSGSNSDSVEVSVNLDDPKSEDLDTIIEIAQEVDNARDRFSLSTAKVQFELDDCTTLEQEAYQAVVNDAKNRAEAIAGPLGATLNSPSVSEPFYSLALPGCSLGSSSSFPNLPTNYEPGMSTDVNIIRQLFFTYTVSPGTR